MHIETLLSISRLFRHIQHPVSLSHICNLAIFWTLAYLEPEAYLKPCKTLTRHIQEPVIGNYSAIFRHIQNLLQRLHVQKPGMLKILEYPEQFHNCILTHIQNPVIRRVLNCCLWLISLYIRQHFMKILIENFVPFYISM